MGFLLELMLTSGRCRLARLWPLCPLSAWWDGREELLRAVDQSKDQSSRFNTCWTQRAARPGPFFCGGLFQARIRALARNFNLPTATARKARIYGFLAGQDYRDFHPPQRPQIAYPWHILTASGRLSANITDCLLIPSVTARAWEFHRAFRSMCYLRMPSQIHWWL